MIDGVPWARPPTYLDPERRLMRNTFHEALDQATGFGAQPRLPILDERSAGESGNAARKGPEPGPERRRKVRPDDDAAGP